VVALQCSDPASSLSSKANLLQVPVRRPHFQETTVLGAALAAGIGVGFWSEDLVFSTHAYNTTEFKPDMSVEEAERRYGHWEKAVQRSFGLADLAD